MRVLGLIPARGGSKGIPRKNIKALNGKPLIAYTIESALESKELSQVVVSTEDQEIAGVCKSLGAEVPFLRPSDLGGDKSPTIDTIIHALEYFEEQGDSFDAVCLLQATVPFRKSGSIKEAIDKFISTGADSLISVQEIPHQFNPNWAFVHEEDSDFVTLANGKKEIIPRRQALPKAYYRNGAIYLTKTEVLINEKSLYGKKIAYLENEGAPMINIDTKEDWLLAEKYIAKHGF